MDENILRQMTGLLRGFAKYDQRWQLDGALRSYEQIRKLPVMSREDLFSHVLKYGLKNASNISATSGSTSCSVLIGHSLVAYRAHLERLVRLYKTLPVARGSLCLNMCSYALNGGGRLMEAGYKGAGYRVVALGPLDMELKADELRRLVRCLRPAMVNAYANQLYGLFSAIGLDNHGIRLCVVNGEPLLRNYKKTIERSAGVEVFNHYGAMEISGLALARRSGDVFMRVEPYGLLLEVLKDNGQSGLSGRGALLVTDLFNRSMPVIRYQIGDRVDLVRREDGFYIKVLGRQNGSFLFDGEVYATQELESAVAEVLEHCEYYFVIRKSEDTGKDAMELRIVGRQDKGLLGRLEKVMIERFRFGRAVRVLGVCAAVPRTITGKIRRIMDLREKDI
jgi:phenylacetate-coenzyme A ligase PaaK-like adenylate-forming protein